MKSSKSFILSIITSLIFVILGLFLFVRPDATITTISYIIGIALLILGILSIIRYFKSCFGISPFDFNLVYGVLVIIAGLYLIFNPLLLEVIFPVILGIWIIINAVTKFQYSLILYKMKKSDFKYTLIISLLVFILGIILLINPLKSILLITQIIGIFIIIYAVLDIIDNFVLNRNKEDFNKLYVIKGSDTNEE